MQHRTILLRSQQPQNIRNDTELFEGSVMLSSQGLVEAEVVGAEVWRERSAAYLRKCASIECGIRFLRSVHFLIQRFLITLRLE